MENFTKGRVDVRYSCKNCQYYRYDFQHCFKVSRSATKTKR